MIKHRMTVEEYLKAERASEVRHEFVEGELVAMAGESRTHYRIARNIARVLEDKAQPGCEVVLEAVKVRVRNERYRYPDVVLSCNPGSDRYFIENPCFIAEVLSESTSEIDHGKKLEEYTRLPSMQTYAIVAQAERRVIVYSRDASGWRVEILEGDSGFAVKCIGASLNLEQIYAGVEFEQPAES